MRPVAPTPGSLLVVFNAAAVAAFAKFCCRCLLMPSCTSWMNTSSSFSSFSFWLRFTSLEVFTLFLSISASLCTRSACCNRHFSFAMRRFFSLSLRAFSAASASLRWCSSSALPVSSVGASLCSVRATEGSVFSPASCRTLLSIENPAAGDCLGVSAAAGEASSISTSSEPDSPNDPDATEDSAITPLPHAPPCLPVVPNRFCARNAS